MNLLPEQQQEMQQEIQRVIRLIQQFQLSKNFTEFDTIKLPFELVELGVILWKMSFTAEILQQVADTDSDTLEAWAIALRKTLDIQLEVLNNWLPHLEELSVPPKMRDKINNGFASIQKITQEKSQLLESAKILFDQEAELLQKSQELQNLKQKEKRLQKIEIELKETDINNLQEALESQAAYLEPQKQKLTSLQRQKVELDDRITALEHQQTTLREEIEYWQSRQNNLEIKTTETVRELITITQQQREDLSAALSRELNLLQEQRNQLSKQQEEYVSVQEQLQAANAEFQKYQTATEEALAIINTHYQSNKALGTLLPIDQNKVEKMMENIRNLLSEIDGELAEARRQNEQAKTKNSIIL